jgi:hypothetical protein
MPKEGGSKTHLVLIGLGGCGLFLLLLCCTCGIGGYWFFGDQVGLPAPAPSFAGTWEDKVGNVDDHIIYQYEFGAFGRGRYKAFDVTASKRGPAKVNAEFEYKVVAKNPTKIEFKYTSVDPPQNYLKPGLVETWRIDHEESKKLVLTRLDRDGNAMIEVALDKVR